MFRSTHLSTTGGYWAFFRLYIIFKRKTNYRISFFFFFFSFIFIFIYLTVVVVILRRHIRSCLLFFYMFSYLFCITHTPYIEKKRGNGESKASLPTYTKEENEIHSIIISVFFLAFNFIWHKRTGKKSRSNYYYLSTFKLTHRLWQQALLLVIYPFLHQRPFLEIMKELYN